MANHYVDKDMEREPRPGIWTSPEGFRFWTLIGIVALIVIAGFNVYELRRRQTDLDRQVRQLANATGVRLVNSRSSSTTG